MIKYRMVNNNVIGLVLVADNMDRLMDGQPIIIKKDEAKRVWGLDVEIHLSYFRDLAACEDFFREGGLITDKTTILGGGEPG